MRKIALPLSASLALLMAACGGSQKQQGQQQMPTPQVNVVKMHAQTLPVQRDLVGRLAPVRTAQVRARVAGIILKRAYTEGTDVQQGDVLFQIDPAPLKAALHESQAALAQARANASNARRKADRFRELASKGVISTQDLDDAVSMANTTAAAQKQAAVGVEKAQLNLSYATVTAPIAGRAGRALVTEGALVGQGEATQLTTIDQIDPIYADFSQSMGEVEKLRKAAARGDLQLNAQNQTPVGVQLPGGSAYPHKGTLDFTDLAVDPDTGAVSLRAQIPNPERTLLPGMFVHVHLTVGHLKHAFEVPQVALQRDDKGAYVMVVGADSKVAQKRVQAGSMRGKSWTVTSGLDEGDEVIVSGLQKVQPGAPAKAVVQSPASVTSAAGPAAAGSASTARSSSARAQPAKADSTDSADSQ